ncbi:alpha/beta hydrolase [Pseudoduganella eburnea]|uniref:Alpha/beta hydrolase n=1 Tax=Massilia eburnea TaxID=1776165 RepID=A0A6L6QQF1_9BURK|nr:dienelactone hydrolase family protein [Massilia eburnea]MTW14405.1 alpha/beta hydrolase [Massilia eburnea]
MQHETVRIDTPAGAVEGTLDLPTGASGVVLFAHGSGSSRFSPRNNFVAGALRNAGIGTLLMDLLTPAEDEVYRTRFNIKLLTERLGLAADWLAASPAARGLALGLFGASTGAAAALQLAAERKDGVAAVVSRGGRPDLTGQVALEGVTAPTLFIVGGRDEGVIELNQAAFLNLHCQKRIDIVPGATHLFEEAGALEEVARLARDWFSQHLGE